MSVTHNLTKHWVLSAVGLAVSGLFAGSAHALATVAVACDIVGLNTIGANCDAASETGGSFQVNGLLDVTGGAQVDGDLNMTGGNVNNVNTLGSTTINNSGATTTGTLTVNNGATTHGITNTGNLNQTGTTTLTGATSINTTGGANTSMGTAGTSINQIQGAQNTINGVQTTASQTASVTITGQNGSTAMVAPTSVATGQHAGVYIQGAASTAGAYDVYLASQDGQAAVAINNLGIQIISPTLANGQSATNNFGNGGGNAAGSTTTNNIGQGSTAGGAVVNNMGQSTAGGGDVTNHVGGGSGTSTNGLGVVDAGGSSTNNIGTGQGTSTTYIGNSNTSSTVNMAAGGTNFSMTHTGVDISGGTGTTTNSFGAVSGAGTSTNNFGTTTSASSTSTNNIGTGLGVATTNIGNSNPGSVTQMSAGSSSMTMTDGRLALAAGSPLATNGTTGTTSAIGSGGLTITQTVQTIPSGVSINNELAGFQFQNKINGNLLVDGNVYVNGTLNYVSSTSLQTAVIGARAGVGRSVLPEATQATLGGVNVALAGGRATHTAVDANGQLSNSNGVVPQTASSLTVTNGLGKVHGFYVDEQQAVISGGTNSTSLTLNDNGARFSNAATGAPVQVHGVADGTAPYDAVNVQQLDRTVNRGVAASMATVAQMPALKPGESGMGVGMGYYGGSGALGWSFAHLTRGGTQMNFGIASSGSGNTTAVRAGVGWKW